MLVWTASPDRLQRVPTVYVLSRNIKKYINQTFLSEDFQCLVVKSLIYLHRYVFVMTLRLSCKQQFCRVFANIFVLNCVFYFINKYYFDSTNDSVLMEQYPVQTRFEIHVHELWIYVVNAWLCIFNSAYFCVAWKSKIYSIFKISQKKKKKKKKKKMREVKKPECRNNSQGPVVQSVVSLTSSLRVISLTILSDSIHNSLIFFAEKNVQHICVSLDENFNELLTDIVTFEQLGPERPFFLLSKFTSVS